ncbi:MAG: serine hydrolase domain-containing protein [Bacteroidota bacterium]
MPVPHVSIRALCFFLTLTLVPHLATAQSSEPTTDQVDALFAQWDHAESPGAAIAIVQDGEVRYKKGYGMANLEHGIPNTSSTIFDIASVSKQFGAMAIAMLAEAGTIALDDEIHTHIPEVPDFGNPITLRHLVHHTSGLRDWPGTLSMAGWQMDDIITFDQILRMVWKQQALNFEPGAEYSYSNTGYNLLAETVARVTDQSFPEWMDAHVFTPLEMNHSHFHDDHQMIVENRAQGYRKAGSQYKMVPNGLTALASSSLFTSVDDLIKWVQNFETKTVGGPAVMSQMHEQGVLNDGKEIAYAFGNSIGSYRGLAQVTHSGGWAAFNTYLVRFPEERFSVIVLSNAGDLNARRRAYEIVDLYLKDRFIPEEPTSNEEVTSITLTESQLDRFVGNYKLGPGWYVNIFRAGNTLKTQATNESAFDMTPVSATKFWVQAYGSHIDFKGPDSAPATYFDYRQYQAPRVSAVIAQEDVRVDAYLGTYYSEELETTYTAAIYEGKLIFQHLRHGTIALSPLIEDVFKSNRWFMREVEFVRNASGEITGFLASDSRSRNVLFSKF